MLKIALLTDVHISSIEEKPLGIDTKSTFLNVLQKAASTKPDLFILNGDLCHKTGEKEIYEWIKSIMDATGVPYTGIPGNHDDPVLMREIFKWGDGNSENEMYYTMQYAGNTLFFLDTSKAQVSVNQLQWLERILEQSHFQDIIIFMHHPPVICGSLGMGPKYQLEDMTSFDGLFRRFSGQRFHIFCGHYHMERTVTNENITVHIAPSTFVQINPDFEHFVKGNDLVGFREIYITSDGKILTNCRYC